MFFNNFRLSFIMFNHFICVNNKDEKEGVIMNGNEQSHEYSFESCSYIVSRKFGNSGVNELIKEKLTSEKSNRIIEAPHK